MFTNDKIYKSKVTNNISNEEKSYKYSLSVFSFALSYSNLFYSLCVYSLHLNNMTFEWQIILLNSSRKLSIYDHIKNLFYSFLIPVHDGKKY